MLEAANTIVNASLVHLKKIRNVHNIWHKIDAKLKTWPKLGRLRYQLSV